MATTEEMLEIALKTMPDAVSLVPESPDEVTTEGGLNILKNESIVRAMVKKLRDSGIFVSAFLDPDTKQIDAAKSLGVQQVEICTGEYAVATLGAKSAHGAGAMHAAGEIKRIHDAAVHAHGLGMKVAAGHGLTYRNVGALSAISEITEFNIGHNIISRAVFTGLYKAVEEMVEKIRIGAAV
jgi:pyridoxine 5-phosphate synthase